MNYDQGVEPLTMCFWFASDLPYNKVVNGKLIEYSLYQIRGKNFF